MIYIKNFIKYKDLLKQLVIKDIKVKYRRSFLGMFWSLLNPLLMMIVINFVFSNLFRFDIPNYPIYLLTGIIIWNFFAETTSLSMLSIISGASLIKKVYVPKYIFPISKVISSFVNLLFAFCSLLILMFILKVKVSISIIFVPVSMILILIFCIGFSLILSAYTVFFRDLIHIYNVILTAWMYATPVFYPKNIVPEQYRFIIRYNPINYLLDTFRIPILYGKLPGINTIIISIIISVSTLILGLYIFYKKQDRFILNI